MMPRLESAQRDVAGELLSPLFGCEPAQGFGDLPVQFRQLAVAVSSTSPNHPRVVGAGEKSKAMRDKPQVGKGGANRGQGRLQRGHLLRRHIAKKLQRDVKLVGSCPTNCPGRRIALQAALGAANLLSHFRRHSDGDEQAQKWCWIVGGHFPPICFTAPPTDAPRWWCNISRASRRFPILEFCPRRDSAKIAL